MAAAATDTSPALTSPSAKEPINRRACQASGSGGSGLMARILPQVHLGSLALGARWLLSAHSHAAMSALDARRFGTLRRCGWMLGSV
jgi:hypothetical protein